MGESSPGSGSPPPRDDETLPRRCLGEGAAWTAAFVWLGLAARAVRWHADVPLWGNETAVALSVLDHGYGALAGPIDLGQVVPLGFL
jgi:hypothetical protein